MTTMESLHFFKAEIVLLLGACITLFTDSQKGGRLLPTSTALITLAASAALAWSEPVMETVHLFQGFLTLDGLSRYIRILILLATAAVVLLSTVRGVLGLSLFAESVTLLLFLCFGLILMAASSHFLMLFLAVEMVSLLSYLMAGFTSRSMRSREASLKYLLFGSFCSAFMLYGISLLFGLAGSLEFSAVQAAAALEENRPVLLCAFLFVLAGAGFKISMFPFHFWAPDVYEAAPAPAAAYFTVAPKAAGFALLIRLLAEVFPPLADLWSGLLGTLCLLTMTAGNILALSQTRVRRLIAYSSIAQAGYLLIGVCLFSKEGLQAVLVYLAGYGIANLGVFTALIALSSRGTQDHLDDLAGMAWRKPFASASLSVFLLSLAGLPPLAGFIGKFLLFTAALKEGEILLFLAAVMNSVIGAFFYFKIIRTLYFSESLEALAPPPSATPMPVRVLLFLFLAGTLVIGLFPSPLLDAAANIFF